MFIWQFFSLLPLLFENKACSIQRGTRGLSIKLPERQSTWGPSKQKPASKKWQFQTSCQAPLRERSDLTGRWSNLKQQSKKCSIWENRFGRCVFGGRWQSLRRQVSLEEMRLERNYLRGWAGGLLSILTCHPDRTAAKEKNGKIEKIREK